MKSLFYPLFFASAFLRFVLFAFMKQQLKRSRFGKPVSNNYKKGRSCISGDSTFGTVIKDISVSHACITNGCNIFHQGNTSKFLTEFAFCMQAKFKQTFTLSYTVQVHSVHGPCAAECIHSPVALRPFSLQTSSTIRSLLAKQNVRQEDFGRG